MNTSHPYSRSSMGRMGLRAVASLCLLSSLSACVLAPPPPPPVVLLPLPMVVVHLPR